MNALVTAAALALLLAGPAAGAGPISLPDDPAPVDPPEHQDALTLGRIHSGLLPPDGLCSFGLGVRTYNSIYKLDGQLERISQKDVFLQAEAGIFTWLHAGLEVPWRSWSGGRAWIPESGSGTGDGTWQVTAGRALWGRRLYAALGYGGNLAVGSKSGGLTEGVFSPRAGGTLTLRFWEHADIPEMRIHLHYGRTWNKAEDNGYGMGGHGFQPWPERYPAADPEVGPRSNDLTRLGAALEFRRASTSLWLEYSRDRFLDHPDIAEQEQLTAVSAGLRWGLVEGWALHGKYLVSIADDDPTTDWYPAYPQWLMSIAVTRQFSFGGRDRDGDGIPDRKDHCPTVPEDWDGFADGDGCPEADNDGDGIPDALDGAPDAPEDFDGYQDEDGVPDYDNDGDGIPDRKDLCPDQPEDYDGHFDKDGCPDDFLDADLDGIDDGSDDCPELAEDHDGFEDEDGCPELDNDLDGIPDAQDKCPNEPENYNGIEDEDGCPD